MSSAKPSNAGHAGAGRSSLAVWLDGCSAGDLPTMSWVHATAPSVAQAVVERGHTLSESCEFFGRALTYLNYGRPAYPFGDDRVMKSALFGPVIFVFHAIVEAHGVSLFPFDTGAFHKGLYGGWIPREYPLDSYEMKPGEDVVRRLIRRVYGSNEAYWVGQADGAGTFEGPMAVALMDMYGDPSVEPADDRRYAIELAVAAQLPINREYVRAVVVPDSLAADKFVLDLKHNKNIPVFVYRTYPRKKIIEHRVFIEEKVREIEARFGGIK